MSFGEIVRTALSEIGHHKMRSVLTTIGIVLGTLSITVMTSLLDGIVATVWDGFEQLGYDGVIFVVGREPRDLRDSAIFLRSKGLMPEDADALLARGGRIDSVAPIEYYQDIVRYGAIERKAQVTGVTAAFGAVRNRNAARGRMIGSADEQSFAKVCVPGHRLARDLFGSDEAVGKTIRLGGRPFTVIGVGEKLGNQFVNDSDMIEEMEGLTVPLSTLRKYFTGTDGPVTVLAVRTRDTVELGDLVSEVRAALRSAHRGAEDFRVENIAEEIVRSRQEVKVQLRNWRVVLGTIAGISLLVGGIGLMSVMLISIGERMYEIGLRKAIGATNTQVFVQFLAESVTLALIGGTLGVAAGAGITMAVGGFFKSGLPISLGGLALGLGISVLLGLVYGAYPALIASRMPPVDALRSAG